VTGPSLLDRVQAALEGPLKPSLLALGMELKIDRVESAGVVVVRLSGSCPSCPSSTMSLIMGLEQQLRQAVPEVAYLEVTAGGEFHLGS
jgi:Fe-S cluster biogenesis protein NfuA